MLADEGLGDRPGQEHGHRPQEEGDDGQDHCLGHQELPALGDGGQRGADLSGGVLPGDDEGSQDRDHDLPECQALSDEVLRRVLVLLGSSEDGGEAGAEQNGQGDGDEGGDPGRAQGPELDPLGVHGAQEGLAALDAGARWARCGPCGGGPDGVAHRCGADWGGGGVCGAVSTHGWPSGVRRMELLMAGVARWRAGLSPGRSPAARPGAPGPAASGPGRRGRCGTPRSRWSESCRPLRGWRGWW